MSPVAKKRMTKTMQTMGRTMLARWKQILMFLFCLLVITDTLTEAHRQNKGIQSKTFKDLIEDKRDSIDQRKEKRLRMIKRRPLC